jgi:hypothetical protein
VGNDARFNSWSQRSGLCRQHGRGVVALDCKHQRAVREDLGLRGLIWYLVYANQSLAGIIVSATSDLQARFL